MGILKLIARFYNIQIVRYRKKGIKNCIIAVILLYLIFVGAHEIGQYYWPSLIEDQQLFAMQMSFLIHFFCQFLYFLIYLPGYLELIPFYKNYLINKQMIPPWKRQNWSKMKLRTAFFLFINQAIVYPLIIFFSMKLSGIKVRFQNFPSTLEIFYQIVLISYIQDFFFFWCHKLSHDVKFLYKFHKVHHQYDYVYSLATQYTHPIDYIFGILIPSAIPFMILGSKVHCFMLLFWQVWKIFISSQGHCGYQFPWSPTRILPFVSGPSYHDFHHSKNMGNYSGSIYIWDTIFSTNETYMNSFITDQKINQKTL